MSNVHNDTLQHSPSMSDTYGSVIQQVDTVAQEGDLKSKSAGAGLLEKRHDSIRTSKGSKNAESTSTGPDTTSDQKRHCVQPPNSAPSSSSLTKFSHGSLSQNTVAFVESSCGSSDNESSKDNASQTSFSALWNDQARHARGSERNLPHRHKIRRLDHHKATVRHKGHNGPAYVRSDPRAHVEDVGDLFRLCQAVPYLLGPKSYLVTLSRPKSYLDLPDFITKNDIHNVDVFLKKATEQDQALLQILCLASKPQDQQPTAIQNTLRHFTIFEEKLVVWEDTGWNRQPEERRIDLKDFLRMANHWAELQSPNLVIRDHPDTVTPWTSILREVRARNLPVEEIDQLLYEQLVVLPEPRVRRKLDYLMRHGDLTHKKQLRDAASNVQERTQVGIFWYDGPRVEDKCVLYVKRFSHCTPTGEIPRRDEHDFFWSRHNGRLNAVEAKRKHKADRSGLVSCKSILKWGIGAVLLAGITVMFIMLVKYKVMVVDPGNGPTA